MSGPYERYFKPNEAEEGKVGCMRAIQNNNKIKMLFEQLETPNYVMNNYYADAFMNKLKDKSDPEVSYVANAPLVSDLLASSLSRSDLNYHISVKVFLTRILALASSKELHYAKMHAVLGDKITQEFKDIHSPNMNPSLKVAYLEIAINLVEHYSGGTYLIQTEIWKDIMNIVNDKATVFVVRKVYQFVSKFLWKLNDTNDIEYLNVVLNFILAPIHELQIINLNTLTEYDEAEIRKRVEPMLNMLLAIFSEEERIRVPSTLVNCLISDCAIMTHLQSISARMRSEGIVLLCLRVLFWANLAKIFQTKPLVEGVQFTQDDFLELNVFFFNSVRFLIQRRNPKLVLDFCNACNMIWNVVWQNQKPVLTDDGKKLEVQNQILFISVMPLLVWITMDIATSEITEDATLFVYSLNILKISSEHTTRAAYSMRDLMMETDVTATVMHSVKLLTCMQTHLSDDQANILFQVLFFVLKDFAPGGSCSGKPNHRTTDFIDLPERVVVISHVMEIVLSLVKNYNITWNESIEVLCLYSVVHDILQRQNLPPKFVVVSLKVLTLSVTKFLTPNLSLLMASEPGSAPHEIGSFINRKMSDMNWEVRDSALELLYVCTDICYIKFPPFQKQIMEENLINVAATIAFKDYEAYVQASALKCLGAASKVPCIWEQLKTEYPNIQEQLLSILRTHSEGIVRKEACNVLCEIYQHVKLSAAAKHTLYEYMVSSALSDFHWEVQISALKFWRIVIETLLTEQGMLDCTFPPVTFSKESRKIVTLNDAEIQKRLLKVLDELSSIGCLTVLVKLLSDDVETDPMEQALALSLELLNVLNKYKVPECIKPNDGDPLSVDELITHIKEDDDADDMDTMPSTTHNSENVIEGIIKSDDINLLANIYERHMSLQNSQNPDSPIRPKIRLLKSASPHLFVTHLTSKDFKVILEQNKKWKEGIRSLSSLLDDMLGIYEVNEAVNSLDCY